MKKSTKLAITFVALASAAGSAAIAAERSGGWRDGMHGRAAMQFQRADADDNGDVTFEEFSAAVNRRVTGADADNDGKMTVEEIANEIMRARFERQARRIIDRFDVDGDGALTKDEVESRQKKLFALMDRNDDGKIEEDEMPRRGFRHMRGMMGHGMMGGHDMMGDDADDSDAAEPQNNTDTDSDGAQ